LDEEALTSLQGRIRHFASDQGPSVGKCGKVLASEGRCPNLAYINFDAAHQVRIASKDPLHALPGFDLQWQRLFGPGALIPSIHNSEIWHARLLAAQKQVLKIYEHQGGIDKVLKSFSFASQRFDSTASPLVKYCCLIRSIALLCGAQAADVSWLDLIFAERLCEVVLKSRLLDIEAGKLSIPT